MSSSSASRKVCLKCGKKRLATYMRVFGTIDGVTHWICVRRTSRWAFSKNEPCFAKEGGLYNRYLQIVKSLLHAFKHNGVNIDKLLSDSNKPAKMDPAEKAKG